MLTEERIKQAQAEDIPGDLDLEGTPELIRENRPASLGIDQDIWTKDFNWQTMSEIIFQDNHRVYMPKVGIQQKDVAMFSRPEVTEQGQILVHIDLYSAVIDRNQATTWTDRTLATATVRWNTTSDEAREFVAALIAHHHWDESMESTDDATDDHPSATPLADAQELAARKLSRLLTLITHQGTEAKPDRAWKVWRKHTNHPEFLDKMAGKVAEYASRQDRIDYSSRGLTGDINQPHEVRMRMLNSDTMLTALHPTRPDAHSGKLITLEHPSGIYLMKTKYQAAAPTAESGLNPDPDPVEALAALTQALVQNITESQRTTTIGLQLQDHATQRIIPAIRECAAQRLHLAQVPVNKQLDPQTVVQLTFTSIDPEANIFLAEYAELESIDIGRQLIFTADPATGFIFCDRTSERGEPQTETTVTALVTGPQSTLANAAATLGLELNYVETGDEHHHAAYSEGPAILAKLAALAKCDHPPLWDNLNHEEKRALVTLAAASTL